MNLPSGPQVPEQLTILEKLKQDCRAELDRAKKEMSEINMLVEQSQIENTRLQQRNATITVQLQQVQSQMDIVSKPDLRAAYDAALDTQQRLFVMKGQIDKLLSDQIHIESFIGILDRVIQALEAEDMEKYGPDGETTSLAKTVEMIIQAQEAERKRLARQMHDGPAQALSNFILQTEIAMRLFDVDQARAREELSGVKTAAASTFQKVRDFIFDLRPMMLDDLGLVPTLTRYVETFKEQSGIDVRLISTGMEQRFEPYIEVMIFRGIQELLSNIYRHSQATRVTIQVDSSTSGFKVSLDDNGKGFEVDKVREKGGMGLKVIQDRVQMLGGTMEIHSMVGQGTHILFHIPAANREAITKV